MSVKAKSKNKLNHDGGREAELAEAAAIAGATAETEATPAPEVTSEEPPPRAPLIVRLRLASGDAVVRSFASIRAAQATAVERTVTWVGKVDATVTRSLTASEQFLLGKLRLTPQSGE